MARGKGKRGGGRGGGKRFAAQSAEEIEQRNARLAEFDAARAQRRKDGDDDGDDDDDGSVDSDTRDAQREAMMVGRRVAEITVADDDDDGGERVEKLYKPKGVEALIEVENPNKQKVSHGTKLKDMGSDVVAPMSRREREEKEKEEKAAAYRRKHELGLTEEYKRDMEKLAEVKTRREAGEAKARAEKEAIEQAESERKAAADAANAAFSDDEDEDDKKKKKGKKTKPVIAKIDKITIKKMKPAQLKEALKERDLEIQGSAKELMTRLLAYEENR